MTFKKKGKNFPKPGRNCRNQGSKGRKCNTVLLEPLIADQTVHYKICTPLPDRCTDILKTKHLVFRLPGKPLSCT